MFNCQKEDTTDVKPIENQSFSYKVTSLDKLTKLQAVINNVKQVKPKTSEFARNFNDFLPLENIDTDNVIQYTDSTGYSTYTFKIVNEDETSINFENLHLLETGEGYIGYILSYEPNEQWYNSNSTITPNGDVVLDISNFQGDITKYSFERDVIWSTKQENTNSTTTSRAGQFIEICVYSVQPMCDYAGSLHPWGDRCTGNLSYATVENCQTVWASGGGGASGNGDGGGDGSSGGGSGGSNPCNNVSGTSIIDEEPLSGVDSGCAPNEDLGIFPATIETICTLGVNVLSSISNCLQINSFEQPEISNWLNNPDNACEVGQMAIFINENGCSETKDAIIEYLDDVSSIIYPDCSSFEFAQPPGESVRACAVIGMQNTFYAYGVQNGTTGTFEMFIGYPLVYFTMPTWRTNGQSATLTAKAVNKAYNKTEAWFVLNPFATEQQIGNKLSSYILNEMAKYGGTMTQTPPFNIPSPAPYMVSLAGTGNCD